MTNAAIGAMRLRARAAVLVVVAGFMLASPAHRVFGGRSPYLRDWMLYRDVGVGLIEARFVRRDAQGEHAVDRFAALGVQRASAPRSLTHLQGEAGLHRVCAQLCAALGPGTDLRVYARIATTTGWAELERGEHDRCEPLPPRPLRLDVHPRGLHE